MSREEQEFSLDDILNEFSDKPKSDKALGNFAAKDPELDSILQELKQTASLRHQKPEPQDDVKIYAPKSQQKEPQKAKAKGHADQLHMALPETDDQDVKVVLSDAPATPPPEAAVPQQPEEAPKKRLISIAKKAPQGKRLSLVELEPEEEEEAPPPKKKKQDKAPLPPEEPLPPLQDPINGQRPLSTRPESFKPFDTGSFAHTFGDEAEDQEEYDDDYEDYDDYDVADFEEDYEPRKRPPYDLISPVDTDFTAAARKCTKKITRFSVLYAFTMSLFLAAFVVSFMPHVNLLGIEALTRFIDIILPYQDLVLLVCQAGAMVFGLEVLISGFYRLAIFSPTTDTLIAMQTVGTLAHAIFSVLSGRNEPSFVVISVFVMLMAIGSKRSKLITQKRTYTAVSLSPIPIGVKIVKEKKAYTAVKSPYNEEILCQHITAPTAGERAMTFVAPFIFILPLVMTLLLCKSDFTAIPWVYSALTTLSLPFGFINATYYSHFKGIKKLFTSGTAFLDNSQLKRLYKTRAAVLQDSDIFPPGSVEITGLKVIDNTPIETVLSYTTAMFEYIGGGAHKAFYDIAKTRYAPMRKAKNINFYDNGGMSAKIDGIDVLFGNSTFLMRMGIKVTHGISSKNNIFMAIGPHIAAAFTIQYNDLPQTYSAFRVLAHFGVRPALYTLDFQVNPMVMEDIFDLNPSFIDYPPIENRTTFDPAEHGTNQPPVAILSRDNAQTFSEVIAFGKRSYSNTRFAVVCSAATSALGLFLMAFLIARGETAVASTYNVLCYLLLWHVPIMIKNTSSGKF